MAFSTHFDSHGIAPSSVEVAWVPGAFELPLAAMRSVYRRRSRGVVCLGAVIRGDTPHFDFVAGECAAGLQRVNLDTGVPVVFGVLTTDTVTQALERSVPGVTNKGYEAADHRPRDARPATPAGFAGDSHVGERLGRIRAAAGAPERVARGSDLPALL